VAVVLAAGLAAAAAALVDGRSSSPQALRRAPHARGAPPSGRSVGGRRSAPRRRPGRGALRWFGSSAPPAVGELLAGLAAELAAGQPPGAALLHAAAELHPPPCPRACRAAAAGGDVPAALRDDARAPGAADLAGLAACWEVAEHSGAGLAQAVARLAEGVRATAEGRDQLRAEVAAAQASARMLAGLPLFGLLLGHWLGAHPLGWLLGTWPGRLALGVGLALEVLGLVWLARMVSGVRAGL
jgi:tight adherence protein B